MILPTPKTIASCFRTSLDIARKLRKALDSAETNVPLLREWDAVLEAANESLNEVLGPATSFGVCLIRGEWRNDYWCDIRALYVNTGDTYNPTFIYDREKNRLYCTTLGDFVESLERKGEMLK